MMAIDLFANESVSLLIDDLSIKNRRDKFSIYDSIKITDVSGPRTASVDNDKPPVLLES
jgi:hypothetical protein